MKNVLDKLSPEEFFICPNCDLEFLPYPIAIKKIEAMRENTDFNISFHPAKILVKNIMLDRVMAQHSNKNVICNPFVSHSDYGCLILGIFSRNLPSVYCINYSIMQFRSYINNFFILS